MRLMSVFLASTPHAASSVADLDRNTVWWPRHHRFYIFAFIYAPAHRNVFLHRVDQKIFRGLHWHIFLALSSNSVGVSSNEHLN